MRMRTIVFALAAAAALPAAAVPASTAPRPRFYTYSLVSADLKITQQVTASYSGGSGYQKRETVTVHGTPHGRDQIASLQIDKRLGVVAAPTAGSASWTATETGPDGTHDCSGSSRLAGMVPITAALKVTGRVVRALWPIAADGSDPVCGLAITFANVVDRETVPLNVFRRKTVVLTFQGRDSQTNTLAAGIETQQLEWTGSVTLRRLAAF